VGGLALREPDYAPWVHNRDPGGTGPDLARARPIMRIVGGFYR
jgi:hypothetical protein